MILKINNKKIPTSWDEFSFGDFLEMKKTKKDDLVSFFLDKNLKDLNKYEQNVLLLAFEFVNEKYELEEYKDKEILQRNSIEQKFSCLVVIKNNKGDLEQSLPALYAILSQDKECFSQEEYKTRFEKIMNMSFRKAYPLSISYANPFFKNEETLDKILHQIKDLPEEKEAGIEDLRKIANQTFFEGIAKEYNLSIFEAEKISIQRSNTFLICRNKINHFQRNLQKVYKKKAEALYKKRNKKR